MTVIKQNDFIASVAGALQYISFLPSGGLHYQPRQGV